MSEKPGAEWVGTSLEVDRIDPRGMIETSVEFDDGEEVLTPKNDWRFGSCDLDEAARYLFFLSNQIANGGEGWTAGRHDRPHGVRVIRRTADADWSPVAGEVLMRRVCVRYEDGKRVCFVPEGGAAERFPGTGPYDTGAA